MILLGLSGQEKLSHVQRYRSEHGITKTFVLSGENEGELEVHGAETIHWPDLIRYKTFYRLLAEIDARTLLVIDECLRTQERSDLTYNCVRHYLNQTSHQLVCQYLPIIDTAEDFMVLLDFETKSRFKGQAFSPELLKGVAIDGVVHPVRLEPIRVEVDAATAKNYAREKRKLIDGIGLRDPHTIPRNLYLVSGKAKLKAIDQSTQYVGRNNRFKLPNLATYKDAVEPSTVFEFCHAFGEFGLFLARTRQHSVPVLVADTKCDQWYFDRYQQWTERLASAYANILPR